MSDSRLSNEAREGVERCSVSLSFLRSGKCSPPPIRTSLFLLVLTERDSRKSAHLNDLEGLLVGGVLLKELSDRTKEERKEGREGKGRSEIPSRLDELGKKRSLHASTSDNRSMKNLQERG